MSRVVINGKFLSQQTTGVQMFAHEITKQLVEKLPNAQIFCPKNASIPNWAKPYTKTVGNKSGIAWEQIELPKALNAEEKPLLLNLCNAAPINYNNQVITLHDVAFIDHPEWFSKSFSLWYKFLIKRIVSKARRVITVSKFSQNRIHSVYKVPVNEINVIQNGVPSDMINLNLPKEKIIITAGSLDPRKNLDTIINGFIEANLSDWKLIIVGGKNASFSNVDLVNHSNIEWTGYLERTKLIELYNRAVIYISASRYEGFGIPVLEAMKAGCRIMLSDIPVYRELYTDQVYYFETDNKNEIANLLRTFQNTTPLATNHITTLEKYSYNHSSDTFVKLIQELS